RAGDVGPLMVPQTGSPLEDHVMSFPVSLRRWIRAFRPAPRQKPAAPRHGCVLWMEVLEDRCLPSTYTVMNLADHGPGSLRQAVLDANAHPGADTIRFAPGLHGPLALTGGELNITDSLTIAGPGEGRLAISGNHASRVFHVSGAATVTIRDLAV